MKLKHTLIIVCAIIVAACSQTKQTGEVTLSGKFAGNFPVGQIFTVKVEVPNLVFDNIHQFFEYETTLESDGTFSLSIPLYSPVYAMVSINEEDCGAILLSPDKKAKIELFLNAENKMQFKMIKGEQLTLEDVKKINEASSKFINSLFDIDNSFRGLRYNMSPEEYKDSLLKYAENQMVAIVDKNENLSENLKQLVRNELKWWSFIGTMFDYEGQMQFLYDKDTIFTPPKPDKSYYSFLRNFDWNNPPKLFAPSYSATYKDILNTDVLNIPAIDSLPLSDWLKETKVILADLVGFNSGIFYDFLVCNAYFKQLDEYNKPLSDNQIADIKIFFKNPTFTKFLFTKNDEVKKGVIIPPLKINKTPQVPKDKLLEAIVAKYKGKVVVVDFWATSCGPCMQAMKATRQLKSEMIEKDVVFVYITYESSPKEAWEEKIKDIGGEQYYLSNKELETISNSKKYGFDGIPTYLIFDKNGNLTDKIVGYLSNINEEMRKMIEKNF